MTPGEPRAGRGALVSASTALACIAIMVAMGLGWDGLTSRETYTGRKQDYYSSLVHGFLAGHLYLDVTPDPGLENPDPVARQHVPTLLDASYYKGHFYLSYGVTPAALILLPYAWLTGGDLECRVAVALCVVLGFAFSLGIWRMALSDHPLSCGICFQCSAVAGLAFMGATPLLLTRAMFYELAVAAGYACVMGGCFWIYRALAGRGPVYLSLALASSSLGLAAGCRPDLVLTVPALAAAALWIGLRSGARAPHFPGVVPLMIAALLPAAVIGAGLAAYNFERFGNPVDFGFIHGQNEFFFSHDPLGRADFLWTNLRWDYLTFPALSPFFPYVFPEAASFRPVGYHGAEAIHGQFPVFVLGLFLAASIFTLRKSLHPGRLAAFLGVVGWMFVAPFVALSFIGLRADRYLVDFQPALVLTMILLAGLVATRLGKGPRRRAWGCAFAAITWAAASFNILAGLEEFGYFMNTRPVVFKRLERAGNYPAYEFERLGLLPSGPVDLQVVFPRDIRNVRVEPLVTAGTPDRTDSVNVAEFPGDRIQFIADHHGYGGPKSQIIPITAGRSYTLKVDMGALYPPSNSPFFDGYSLMQTRLAKTKAVVLMDGVPAIDAKMSAYDAPPWSVESGRNDISLSLFQRRFTGSVLSVARRPPPDPGLAHLNNGLWRIRCVLPLEEAGKAFPLLSAGLPGSGTLVYVSILAGSRVRFGVDEWSLGGEPSETTEALDKGEHTIEICLGPLAARAPWPGDWGFTRQQFAKLQDRIRVWLDGRLVLNSPVHREFDSTDSLIDVGTNLQGFSSAVGEFVGPLRSEPYTAEEERNFLILNIKPPVRDSGGLWRLRGSFPMALENQSLPIVSAGTAGSGSLVYLKILPANQVRFGLDEWSIGGELSGPIRLKDLPEHVISLFVGPLAKAEAWPADWAVSPQQLAESGQKVRVWLDGQLVLESAIRGNFASPSSLLEVGSNPQGFSTAQPDFKGALEWHPFAPAEAREFLKQNLTQR